MQIISMFNVTFLLVGKTNCYSKQEIHPILLFYCLNILIPDDFTLAGAGIYIPGYESISAKMFM